MELGTELTWLARGSGHAMRDRANIERGRGLTKLRSGEPCPEFIVADDDAELEDLCVDDYLDTAPKGGLSVSPACTTVLPEIAASLARPPRTLRTADVCAACGEPAADHERVVPTALEAVALA